MRNITKPLDKVLTTCYNNYVESEKRGNIL